MQWEVIADCGIKKLRNSLVALTPKICYKVLELNRKELKKCNRNP